MLKVWNVLLICLTFFLTIFGTFLTRSGLIASVHSFAQSGIGIYFVYFMGVIIAVCVGAHRLAPAASCAARARSSRVLSREAAFLVNNWGFLSIMVFIAVATTWPRISEWLLDQKSTLGPTFYNTWIPPLALVVFALMGIAPLLGWRKTSPELFKQELPLAASRPWLVVGVAPPRVRQAPRLPGLRHARPDLPGLRSAARLAKLGVDATRSSPSSLVRLQRRGRRAGVRARHRARARSAQRASRSSPSLFHLVAKSRRRYGGYIVHVGIVGDVPRLHRPRLGRRQGGRASSPASRSQIEDYTITLRRPAHGGRPREADDLRRRRRDPERQARRAGSEHTSRTPPRATWWSRPAASSPSRGA